MIFFSFFQVNEAKKLTNPLRLRGRDVGRTELECIASNGMEDISMKVRIRVLKKVSEQTSGISLVMITNSLVNKTQNTSLRK